MVQEDTIKLLRECDAGVKMGISSISEVMDFACDDDFKRLLCDCKNNHERLEDELKNLLCKYKDDGKEPAVMAKGMSWFKTNVKMMLDESDATIADLITDGCNMGVKSLHRYLNQYKAADEKSKDIAKKLINLEERLSIDIRNFL